MNKKILRRYSLVFLAVMFLFIIINAFSVYSDYSSREFFSVYDDVYSKEMILESDNILSNAEFENYDDLYSNLSDEYRYYERYIKALKRLSVNLYTGQFSEEQARELISKESGLTQEGAEQKMKCILLCQKRIAYALGYSQYITTIKNDAESMNAVSIFDTATKKKIIMTGSDYYRLENIHPTACSDEGVQMIFSDTVTDVLACICAVLCAFVYSMLCRFVAAANNSSARKKFVIFSLLYITATAAMYSTDIITAFQVFPSGDPGRSVQSVSIFKSCPYMISLSTFLTIRLLIKTAACSSVYFIFTGILSASRKMRILVIYFILAAAEVLRLYLGFGAGFLSEFSPEKILGSYELISVLGEPVRISVVFGLVTAAFFIITVLAASGSVDALAAKAVVKAENEYFKEIDRKYSESRMIRHDIQNHLTAISVLLDAGDTDGARKYIGEISGELDRARPPVHTGSNVLDALLFQKLNYATGGKIKVNTEFNADFSSCRFSDYDLCSIFSNILDNAFEACEKLDEQYRIVTLHVKEHMNMICIYCENNYKSIQYSAGGFVTLKNDRINHGLGLKRISGLSEKYGGAVEIKTEEGVFSISVLLMK